MARLTEFQLRTIVREELMREMHFMDKAKDMAVGTAFATLISSPMLVRAYLQAHPEMMEKVQAFLQSLMEE